MVRLVIEEVHGDAPERRRVRLLRDRARELELGVEGRIREAARPMLNAVVELEPVSRNAPNLVTAIPTFAPSAVSTALVPPPAATNPSSPVARRLLRRTVSVRARRGFAAATTTYLRALDAK